MTIFITHIVSFLRMNLVPGLVLATLLGGLGLALGNAPGLKVLGALTLAMLLGITLRVLAEHLSRGLPPAALPGIAVAARPVLRAGIVLMGVRLHFGLLVEAGPRILALDCIVVGVGLVGIHAIARALAVESRLGMLVAVGTSICGASAVVAAGPVTRADDDDVTLAVGLCGILGTLGVLALIAAAPLLGLSVAQLGILSGSTLPEVAQVVAAAFTWGEASGDLGTLVKLTRVVLLGPALLILGFAYRAGDRAHRFSWRDPPVPWFVLGFLAMAGLNTLGVLGDAGREALTQASIFLMAMAMAAMGLQVDFAHLRSTGFGVVAAGLAGFGMLVGISWTLIRVLGL